MLKQLNHWILVILVLVGYVHAQSRPNCNTRQYVRRDAANLVQSNGQLTTEGLAYVRGVRCLMQNGQWTAQSRAHLDVQFTAHGVAAFLPWHRLFLLAIEEAMRQCTGDRNIYIP
jgi:hypothetical protein